MDILPIETTQIKSGLEKAIRPLPINCNLIVSEMK